MRAWDPADAVTSHPRPNVDIETRKKPLPGARNCWCFELPTSKFLVLRIWLGQKVPTSSSSLLLMLLALKVRSRGYKWAREGHVPSLWWKERMGAESLIAARLCVRGLIS